MSLLSRLLLGFGLFALGLTTGGYVVRQYDLVSRPAATPPGNEPPLTWEATIYLPSKDHQGKVLSNEVVQNALNQLISQFGGATLDSPRQGRWHDTKQQRVLSEVITPVVISFERHRLEEFRQAIRTLAQRLQQESIYVRFEEPRIEFIGGTPGNAPNE